MEKPNFGESQLQYCVNAEISNAIHEGTGFLISPIIPTLRDEYLEAWDSGFAFPWIMPGPNPDHHGANFFIQYKLSGQLGKKGKEYPRWNKPYFRFTIPHQIKNGNKYQDDYHQWDKLKELANTGYATFYATNHVLRRDELFELSSQKQL